MKLFIPRQESNAIFDDLSARHGITFDVDGCETRLNWSTNLASGFINWTQVKAGLQIQLDSFQPRTNFAIA